MTKSQNRVGTWDVRYNTNTCMWLLYNGCVDLCNFQPNKICWLSKIISSLKLITNSVVNLCLYNELWVTRAGYDCRPPCSVQVVSSWSEDCLRCETAVDVSWRTTSVRRHTCTWVLRVPVLLRPIAYLHRHSMTDATRSKVYVSSVPIFDFWN